MNEKGNYELLASETRSGYQKDAYPVKDLVKAEYNTGETYFKTLTSNDTEFAGLDINTSIRLEDGFNASKPYSRR